MTNESVLIYSLTKKKDPELIHVYENCFHFTPKNFIDEYSRIRIFNIKLLSI